MAENHEKDRKQKQTKQQPGPRPGLKTAGQENEDSPSHQTHGNTDSNTHDT
jgi:hypothetical protein